MPLLQIESKRVGGLSVTTKMPGSSYSISVFKCKTGSRLAKVKGSVCSDCYARKGNYHYPSVKKAHEKRYQSLKRKTWISDMTALIHGHAYFRWHDSGDLQGLWHLKKIIQVCQRTPNTLHWLPTKEVTIVKTFVAQGGKVPQNLNIRISATMTNSLHYPKVNECTGSAVATSSDIVTCPASKQENQCKTCRVCWDKSIPLVVYAKH